MPLTLQLDIEEVLTYAPESFYFKSLSILF